MSRRTVPLATVFGLAAVLFMVSLLTTGESERTTELAHVQDWPAPLNSLCKDDPGLAAAVRVVRIDAMIDQHTVWMIADRPDFPQRLINGHALQASPQSHPKLESLITRIPRDWPQPDLNNCDIFASTGYGTIHQEGVDLFLLVHTKDADLCYVMHEWIF